MLVCYFGLYYQYQLLQVLTGCSTRQSRYPFEDIELYIDKNTWNFGRCDIVVCLFLAAINNGLTLFETSLTCRASVGTDRYFIT